MASDLTVQTIRGPGSGANANKIIIPSGQTLDLSSAGALIPGRILQALTETEYDIITYSSTSYTDSNISITLTTLGANSKFIINGGIGYNLQSTYTGGIDLRLVSVISGNLTEINYIGRGRCNQAGGGDNEWWASYSNVYSPNVAIGTSITFKIQAYSNTTGAVRTGDATNSSMTVMEIAQ
jgi:hypothetical protein